MRKVTQQIAKAFFNGNAKTVGNTHTDGNAVWLHGNKIAEYQNGRLAVTLAGWNTPTTRERVNGILETFNINAEVYQRNFEPCLMYEETRQTIDKHQWLTF